MAVTSSETGSALVPAPKTPEPATPTRGAAPIGLLLEKTRRRLGYSVESVCRALHLTERELNQYESGMRQPPAGDLERLADFYDVHLSRLLPGAAAVTEHEERDVLWLGFAPVDLDTTAENRNRLTIPRIARTIRSIRSLSERAPVIIRNSDLLALGTALDLSDEELPGLVVEWFGVEATQALELIARMRHAVASTKELCEAGDVDVAARECHPNP